MKRLVVVIVVVMFLAGGISANAGAASAFQNLADYIRYGGPTYDKKDEAKAREACSKNEGKKGFSIFQTMAEYAKWGEMPREEYHIPTQSSR